MTFKTIHAHRFIQEITSVWNIGRHCHKHLTTPPFLEIIKAAVKCSRDVMNLRFTQR